MTFDTLCLHQADEREVARAIAWLDAEPKRRLIWVGEEMTFHHPRASFVRFETPLQLNIVAKEVAWQAVLRTLAVETPFEPLKTRIEECHLAADLLLSEVADFGLTAFGHARRNWRQKMRRLDDLKGCCRGIPAIVCGAGPSLEEQAPFLRQMENKALILAGGTALASLNELGIEPHMAGAIDKETPERLFQQNKFRRIPVCLQARLNPDCLQWIEGEKLLAPESGPLPWEEWWTGMERDAFGWTVGNFCAQIAVWLGCNPIIFAGMDLAYRDGKKYAGKSEQKKETLIQANGIWTQRDWILAARWLEELADAHPEIRWINTSLTGLPLRAPIETMASMCLEKEFDVRARLNRAIEKARFVSVKSEAEWNSSIERCLARGEEWEEEPVHRFYLEPLWNIWRPLFAREAAGQDLELHRTLFFQRILGEMR